MAPFERAQISLVVFFQGVLKRWTKCLKLDDHKSKFSAAPQPATCNPKQFHLLTCRARPRVLQFSMQFQTILNQSLKNWKIWFFSKNQIIFLRMGSLKWNSKRSSHFSSMCTLGQDTYRTNTSPQPKISFFNFFSPSLISHTQIENAILLL